MSSPLAVAAVTATLRRLLDRALAAQAESLPVTDLDNVAVTMQPLDRARDPAATGNQVNLFLYLVAPNAAWRNQDMPGHSRPGEIAAAPLALNLYYLLSAYGMENDASGPFSHMLLGHAMSALHDHPLLGAEEIAAALPASDLGHQIERVRITLQPLSIEEISKIWAGFQMQYRLSVAYEAAVVLIDSRRPLRAAPPVLRRGAGGTGFDSTAALRSAWPRLDSLAPARPVRPGETVRARGSGLGTGTITARFAPLLGGAPLEVPAARDAASGEVLVAVPADGSLPAGPCMLSLAVDGARRTTELPLLLAPRIVTPMPATAAAGLLTLTVVTPVRVGQRVALILSDREVPAAQVAGDTLRFDLAGVAPGDYPVRLRVDGVDSLALRDPDAALLEVDPTQMVTVPP
ncbi:DUF4255 domain-containing protein [Dankookia rubra]|uniref:DUF4255 domain-containing protein n=1 Tax=Dankookia rubra TaxID=1442381 RepID=A0A4R5QHM7_9PROT|nr:DUF4255 domain-containing protein [Dankookia rubra]TDH62141.1 DUF4255 domain-containing protein [Dankookia rubra]